MSQRPSTRSRPTRTSSTRSGCGRGASALPRGASLRSAHFRRKVGSDAARFLAYVRAVVARAVTHALVGLEPRRVDVEVHIQGGVPSFAIVGLVDRAVQEAKHRIRSGVASAALRWPNERITVNLAPAQLRKEGSAFDLPIALAILAAARQIPAERLAEHAAVGELGLDGGLRRVGGVLAVAEGASRAAIDKLLCPAECAAEAALAGVEPIPVRHLAEAVAYLRGEVHLEWTA